MALTFTSDQIYGKIISLHERKCERMASGWFKTLLFIVYFISIISISALISDN